MADQIVKRDSATGLCSAAQPGVDYQPAFSPAEAVNDIGIPGAAGFGVGICPTPPAGFTPLSGFYTPTHPNFGNYAYTDGSTMVWIPAFYYLIGTGSNGLAVNVVSIRPKSYYSSTANANADGYALHRAFIDGGAEQDGFFVDKYKVSKNALGVGFVCSSIKNGLPLSAAADHNPMGDLTAAGGVNACYKTIDCAHTRDGVDGAVNPASRFFVTSRFIHAALALLSLAHGQASTGATYCAWYDGTGASNYPKGCNNNNLRDVDDATVVYLTDGYSNCGKTGSGLPFAKTTHNGQECGVADLNGLMSEISLGMTCIATTVAIEGMSRAAACEITWTGHGLNNGDYVQIGAITQADWVGAKDKIFAITKTSDNTFTIPFNSAAFGTAYDPVADPGTVIKGIFYAAKSAAAMKSFTSGNALATDHWGAVGVAALMDAFTPPFVTANGGALVQRFGNAFNQVLSEAVTGAGWLLAGLGIPAAVTGLSAGGGNLFGKDYFYQYIINDLCALACGSWTDTSLAGLWYLRWYGSRTSSYSYASWRCATYPD